MDTSLLGYDTFLQSIDFNEQGAVGSVYFKIYANNQFYSEAHPCREFLR